MGNGAVEIAEVMQHGAEIHMRLGKIWMRGQRLAETGRRRVQAL